MPDEIDNFAAQDRINNLSDITEEQCSEGYEFKSSNDEAIFFKLCRERTDIFTVSEAITIDKSLHARLYLSGSPIPLPEWFRNGNSRCKVTKKSILQNFPPYIKNFSENKSESQFQSDNILDELIKIRYKKPNDGSKFSKGLVQFSLMLRYTSASSYKLMLQHLPLPSISYLSSLCQGSLDPIKAIKILHEKQKIDKDVVLLMDEMYLQKEVQYQEGKLFGSNEEGTMFRGIMTFMVVGLRNNVPFVIKAIPESKIEGK